MVMDTTPYSHPIDSDYGFLSNEWYGCKTLAELNGTRRKYRGVLVDVVDLRTNKKIGRMVLGAALTKFN
jgi:hypothetical protein